IGGVKFASEGAKPTRREGLAYYRAVTQQFALDVRQYEPVDRIEREGDRFVVHSQPRGAPPNAARARAVVIATGSCGEPNLVGVPGEDLPHVTHRFREGHEAFQREALVVGGGNSAVECALDLWRSAARVTLVHFGPTFDHVIKPWILPDFEAA